jgi:hypothetical protein
MSTLLLRGNPTPNPLTIAGHGQHQPAVLQSRIRTFLVGYGSGSGRLGPDPVPDHGPGLKKWPNITFFGVCKSLKYFQNLCCLTFWFMTILFRAYFRQKIIPEET